jgi:hypothetical protein
MLFIYEPIILYINNVNDFWFDIKSLIMHSFVPFLLLIVLIVFLYTLIHIAEKFVFRKSNNLYNIFLVIGFCLFIITYIQGNYLAGTLPALDGKTIEWNQYQTETIISVLLMIIVFSIAFFVVKKFKYEQTIKYAKKIILVVCIMLSVSLITSVLSFKTDVSDKKYLVTATTNNINKYSNNKNFIIFLLDSIDSETMEEIVKNNDNYMKVFDDFTYYPDTVGGYPFTRDSVPLILSGNWNENKTNFASFYNYAMDNSQLLDHLRERDYNINIYNDEISYNTEKAHDIKNFSFDNKIDLLGFIRQELKYDLFKYLPFYLKKYSKIETMNFTIAKKLVSEELFLWDNINFYDDYLSRNVEFSEDNEFKYIHLEGAHYPFNCDKNFNKKDNGTYEDKIEASINLINKYLNYLKDNGVYDNSAIIILADHGFWWDIDDDALLKRQNPILYIKGFNEHHSREISNEKISFDYLQDMYKNLLDGSNAGSVMSGIDNSNPRRFMLYRVFGYNHMEEFFQYGHSKDLNTLKASGNIYDLK